MRRIWLACGLMSLCLPAVGRAEQDPIGWAQTLIQRYSIVQEASVRKALAALKEGNPRKAAEALSRARHFSSPSRRAGLRFLAGYAWAKAGDCAQAAKLFDGLEDTVVVLALHVLQQRFACLLKLGRLREARLVQDRLMGLAAGRADILIGVADMLFAAGRYDEAAATLEGLYAAGHQEPYVVTRLGQALIRSGQRKRAARFLRRALFSAAVRGKQAIRGLLSDIGVTIAPTENDRLDAARSLLLSHRNKEATEQARPLLQSSDRKVNCGAMEVYAKGLAKLRKHSQALRWFSKLVKECSGFVDMAKVLFNAARSALRAGRLSLSRKYAERLWKEYPTSSLCDDVSLWLARAALSRRNYRKARKLLHRQIERWPHGDMADAARWLLAFGEIKRHRYRSAEKLLSGFVESTTDRSFASRFLYWLGRVRQLMGRRKGARKAYLECASSYPMTYYGFLALHRLGGNDRRRLRRLVSRLRKGAKVTRVTLSDKEVQRLGRGPVARGAILVAWGLSELGVRELERAANIVDLPGERLAVAYLLQKAGEFARSHRLAMAALRDAGARWPLRDTEMSLFKLAFPRPFWSTVKKTARELHLNALFALAVMREESAFRPSVESRANAIGLMQLILPTARTVARKLGLERRITPSLLRDPDLNIRLGATYLNELVHRFRHPIPAIAAYNAGPAAVRRWLRRHRAMAWDLFVESLDARETRRYVRRVYGSYAAYTYLYSRKRFLSLEL